MSETKPTITVKLPEMLAVASSYLAEVGHDGIAMFIRFRERDGSPGPAFRYETVGIELHEAMMSAPSAGKHFLQNIRSQHKAVRVAEVPAE